MLLIVPKEAVASQLYISCSRGCFMGLGWVLVGGFVGGFVGGLVGGLGWGLQMGLQIGLERTLFSCEEAALEVQM